MLKQVHNATVAIAKIINEEMSIPKFITYPFWFFVLFFAVLFGRVMSYVKYDRGD